MLDAVRQILAGDGYRRPAFFFAALIYAVAGSPTPDAFGWVEALAGCLFLISLSFDLNGSDKNAGLLAIYFLSVPLFISLLGGNDFGMTIRDMIAAGFLLMPLLYRDEKPFAGFFLVICMGIIGIGFSIRSLIAYGPKIFLVETWLGAPPDLLYLANSPEVLFTAVFCLSRALSAAEKTARARVFFFTLSLIPLLAMAAMMQRAGLLYIALTTVLFLFVLLKASPTKAICACVCIGLAGIAASPFLNDIFSQLALKTRLVGLNARVFEWQAVFDAITQNPLTFLFGSGWGVRFANPAVGALNVNFTHSLLSSLLLKTGMAGAVLFLFYTAGLVRKTFRHRRIDLGIFVALAGPLLIGLLAYASYKSLGYGLCILLLARAADPEKLGPGKPPVP